MTGATDGLFAAVHVNAISVGDALMAKPHLFLAFRNLLRAEPCCVIGVCIVRRYMGCSGRSASEIGSLRGCTGSLLLAAVLVCVLSRSFWSSRVRA